MSSAKPVAIVLAGTNPHIVLIQNLKRRGYYVLLLDYLEAPPAKTVADEHLRVSTLAMREVLALARDRKAALVIATCVDRANVTAAFVAEQLGLPAPYNFATANLIADKLRMKQRLVEAGVPTAAFRALKNPAEVDHLPIGFPAVAKPIDTGGSKGVRKAANVHELHRAAVEAFKVTRCAEILVEEFCGGVEVSADCLVRSGELHVLMLRRKYLLRAEAGTVLCAYASVAPANISSAAEQRIHQAAQDIVRGFGLHTTSLLVQFMVDGDDVRVIEFAPRVGGGLNYRVVPLHTGVDIVDATINAYLGRTTVLSVKAGIGYLATHHVYTEGGCFGEVRNQERLLRDGVVEEFYVNKARGMEFGASLSSSDRAASFIMRAETAEELLGKARQVFDRLDVLDVRGRSIMRRDLYLKAL